MAMAKFEGLEILGTSRYTNVVLLFTESPDGGATDSIQHVFEFDSEVDAVHFAQLIKRALNAVV